jgi:hypothetical protein
MKNKQQTKIAGNTKPISDVNTERIGKAGSSKPIGVVDNYLSHVRFLPTIPEESGFEVYQHASNFKIVPLRNIWIDVTMLQVVKKLDKNLALELEDSHHVTDGHLLPLQRMGRMMFDVGTTRPPVRLIRNGLFYRIADGRHRVVRALLMRQESIGAIVMNEGRSEFLKSGGESNPGPENQSLVEMKAPDSRLYQKRYRKSTVPKDKTSTTIDPADISSVSADSNSSGNDSVHRASGKRNNRIRKNSQKGYRREYRKDQVQLVVPVVCEEKFDADYLSKILTEDNIPSRSLMELKFRATKSPLVYDCPCGKKNYGFPAQCGCILKDQVKAMYNNMIARELDIIDIAGDSKPTSDFILETNVVSDEIRSVESAIKHFTETHEKQQTDNVVDVVQESVSGDLIVRKRRGIYKWLKTPGVFNFRTKINHHHQSIAKHKDQSAANVLVISDEMVIDDLYAYLRRNEFEHYPDRASKLSHMTKLAAKWDMGRFKINAQAKGLTPLEINRYFVTIQKVTDAKDTEFLLQEVDVYHTNSVFRRFASKLGCFPNYLN